MLTLVAYIVISLLVEAYHRLNCSSSTVLMATCLSCEIFAWLSDFFSHLDSGGPNRSSRKMAQTMRMHARMCLLQKQTLLFIPPLNIRVLVNSRTNQLADNELADWSRWFVCEETGFPRAHDLSSVCVICGAGTTLRSCRAGADGVCIITHIITHRLATCLQ